MIVVVIHLLRRSTSYLFICFVSILAGTNAFKQVWNCGVPEQASG